MFHRYVVSPFKYKLCRKALAQVFRTVKFDDDAAQMREILHDSYLVNLNAMIQYAHDNHIDEVAYIFGLREILGGGEYKHER